jgi:glutamate-1-semialdehyde 2,1-aminomutase
MKFDRSAKLYKEGCKHLVGAVNSPVRAFKSVGGNPIFIKEGKGTKITDVDKNTYIDLVQSYGPMILGHKNKKVEKAVERALKKGYTFGASTEMEIKLANLVCKSLNGIDKIRFVNSGTEAVLSALRLARAYTGRSKIIKFSGCYHGHSDALLVAAGSGVATLSIPGSKGVPEEAVRNTLIAEYNNIDSVKQLIDQHNDIAGIILEPIAGNMGVVRPNKEFIEQLNELTSANDILMIVDEVMTGYRAQFGATSELLGFNADIICLGKVIGGGFPVGAYGARNEIMEMVAPLGEMYQAGTLSGNPIAMACGYATLKTLKKKDPYKQFEIHAERIENILLEAAMENNVELTVNRFGSMINPFFTSEKVVDFKSAQSSDTEKFKVFFWAMIENGIYIPPSQFESWFLSAELSGIDIMTIEIAIQKAIKAVSKINKTAIKES